MGIVFIVLSLLVAILIPFYIFATWNFNYWKKRNVPYLKPVPLFGNYQDYITMKKSYIKVAQGICKQFPDEPYIGSFFGTEPALIVQDPELIKLILVKDYPFFNSREIAKYSESESTTKNMFFTYGDKWKVLRQNSTPLFTMSKLKNMFPLIQKCAKSLDVLVDYEVQMSNVIEARSLMARYTMDCIGTCFLGVNTDTMGKSGIEQNPFRKMGDILFEDSTARCIGTYTRAIWPALFYRMGLRLFPEVVVDFFNNLVLGVFKERNYEPSNRNDFIDLLLGFKKTRYLTCDSLMKSKEGEKVTVEVDDEFLMSQCMLYFGAGFETSALTSSFTLYYLARDQNIQQRVVAEIDEYLKKTEGKIELDCMTDFPYLSACIDETLRLFPPLGLLTREVMEPYELPTGLKLEKGMRVHIPVYSMHFDPKYFPEPEKYKPERFLPENKAGVKPFTYMPFGEGQRICIGMKMAKLMIIPGLVTLLRKYQVEFSEGTPRELTVAARTLVTRSEEKLHLIFKPRQ